MQADPLLVNFLTADREDVKKREAFFEGDGPFKTELGDLYLDDYPGQGKLWIWLPRCESKFIKRWRKKDEAIAEIWPQLKAAGLV
jgi:hypothetical protein